MWDLHHLEDLAENGGGANIANLVREVKSRLSQLMETYKDMLLHQNSSFREEVSCKIEMNNAYRRINYPFFL